MTADEARQLPLGLYRVFWKSDDRPSIAAIGMLEDGQRWLAPANWTRPTEDQHIWRRVERVELPKAPSGQNLQVLAPAEIEVE